MAVTASDIVLKLSVAAAAGNTTAGTPATSLGDQVSTTAVTSAQLNNLFDDVSAAEATAGDVEYRCVFVHNTNATDSAFNVVVSIPSQVAGGATYDIATDNTGVTAQAAATAQAATVANEQTAPSGVSAYGAGPLTIGTMGPQTVAGVWVRRTVAAATAAATGDGATLRIAGEG